MLFVAQELRVFNGVRIIVFFKFKLENLRRMWHCLRDLFVFFISGDVSTSKLISDESAILSM
jgi:hypothetical protein